MADARSAREILDAASAATDSSSTLALVGIGRALLEQVDEQRTQTLVAYLQTLLMNPAPDASTVSQIEAVSSVLERRLGLAPSGAGS